MRSRAHDNATGTIASGLDMWHDAHGSSKAARFASHSSWEVQHDQSILQDQARHALTTHALLCKCDTLCVFFGDRLRAQTAHETAVYHGKVACQVLNAVTVFRGTALLHRRWLSIGSKPKLCKARCSTAPPYRVCRTASQSFHMIAVLQSRSKGTQAGPVQEGGP